MPHTHFLKIYLTHEECDLIFAALCIGCFVSSIKDIEVSVIIILDLHNYDIAALTQLTVISYPVLFDFQDQILGYQYQLYQHIREERWLSFTYFGHHYDHHVVFLISPYEHYWMFSLCFAFLFMGRFCIFNPRIMGDITIFSTCTSVLIFQTLSVNTSLAFWLPWR